MLKFSLKNVQTSIESKLAVVGRRSRCVLRFSLGIFGLAAFAISLLASENSGRPDVQKTNQDVKNPYSGQRKAAKAGRKLFVEKCARCHGHKAEGSASVPALAGETTQSVPEGVIFAYITRGDVGNGMPSWASLPEHQRWQIVTYLKSLSRLRHNIISLCLHSIPQFQGHAVRRASGKSENRQDDCPAAQWADRIMQKIDNVYSDEKPKSVAQKA